MKTVQINHDGSLPLPSTFARALNLDPNVTVEVRQEGDELRVRKIIPLRTLMEHDPIWKLIGAIESSLTYDTPAPYTAPKANPDLYVTTIDPKMLPALFDKRHPQHALALDYLNYARDARFDVLMTDITVAECDRLLVTHFGQDFARRWLSTNIWPIAPLSAEDHATALELLKTTPSLSYADAAQMAWLQRNSHCLVLSFDLRYRDLGIQHLVPLSYAHSGA